jgi:hypothetical protein
MDYFTKWLEAHAIPNQEASTVADVLVSNFRASTHDTTGMTPTSMEFWRELHLP